MIRRVPLGLALLLAAVAASPDEQVYQKTTDDGVVEFSDQPSKGATAITVTEPTVISIPPAPDLGTGKSDKAKQQPSAQYSKLAIVSPQDDEPIRSNAGDFSATAVMEPQRLAEGHRIRWLFDGEEVAGVDSLKLSLHNLDRGTHRIQVEIVDEKSNVVKASDPVSFHLLRAAAGS